MIEIQWSKSLCLQLTLMGNTEMAITFVLHQSWIRMYRISSSLGGGGELQDEDNLMQGFLYNSSPFHLEYVH